MMRNSKPILRSTAVVCLFVWTIYSHVSSRRLIYQELHSLRGHTSRYLQESDSEAPVATLEQNELLGVVVGAQQHSKFLVGPEVDKSDSFWELLFERGFEESLESTFPQSVGASGSQQVWLYSLINCDYNGAALVPHFMRYILLPTLIDALFASSSLQ